ncbi:hypothetical protein HJ590_13205 [Naumannella sp. ID2617S]|nr:hypothetical protein [Naumannella sp. ID2617S]
MTDVWRTRLSLLLMILGTATGAMAGGLAFGMVGVLAVLAVAMVGVSVLLGWT